MSNNRGPRAEFTIRTAAAADVPDLVTLINTAYRVEEFFIEGDRTDDRDISQHMRKGEFFVAERGAEKLKGCVYVEAGLGRGYFGMLSVSPDSQGAGLGRFLVAEAERHCRERGATTMDLKVVDLRAELAPWYERLGYVETGREPFSAPEILKMPAEFIAMSKDLGPLPAETDPS